LKAARNPWTVKLASIPFSKFSIAMLLIGFPLSFVLPFLSSRESVALALVDARSICR
jgi:hypothetical protein